MTRFIRYQQPSGVALFPTLARRTLWSGLESEEAVMDRAVALIRESPSLVMAAYSPQNLDRFVSYYKAALKAGRTFICDHYQAAVLYQLNSPRLPKPSRDKLPIYLPQERKRLAAYENRFQDAEISLRGILAAPDRFVMLTRPSMILNDFSRCLPQKTRLLYGMWSGYRVKPRRPPRPVSQIACAGPGTGRLRPCTPGCCPWDRSTE